MEYAGPRFDAAASRFYSFDGTPLGLTAWTPAEGTETWAVVVGLHGINDYARTFETVGPYFAQRGVAVFAYDARGHGRSPNRGVWGGERLMTEDVRTAVAVARRMYPNATVAVMGESMGAATAIATFGSDSPPVADRIVLVSPAVWGWSTLPDLYAVTLWLGAHTLPGRPVSAPRNVTRRIVASNNTEMLRRIGRDPNMLFRIRVDTLYGLVNLMQDASDRVGSLRAPTFFAYGAHDQVVPRASALSAARRLAPSARTVLYGDHYHMMTRDLNPEPFYEDVLAFLRDPNAVLPSGAPPFVPRPTQEASR